MIHVIGFGWEFSTDNVLIHFHVQYWEEDEKVIKEKEGWIDGGKRIRDAIEETLWGEVEWLV